MQFNQYQESEQYPEASHRGAAWLNGITWVIMALCFLTALASPGYEALIPILFLLAAAGCGAIANLVMCLWCYATDRSQQAEPYLIGFLPLVLLAWWLVSEFSHIGKIGG